MLGPLNSYTQDFIAIYFNITKLAHYIGLVQTQIYSVYKYYKYKFYKIRDVSIDIMTLVEHRLYFIFIKIFFNFNIIYIINIITNLKNST